jgi:hypothetical protein
LADAELMESMLDVARQAGLTVKRLSRGRLDDYEAPTTSGVCQVRGEVWVMLSPTDPSEVQLEVLARALREHAPEFVAAHFLPPALRERLSPEESW